jgi:hypothetical protein
MRAGAFGAVYRARPTAKAIAMEPELAHYGHVALKHLFPFAEVRRRRDELHWLRMVLYVARSRLLFECTTVNSSYRLARRTLNLFDNP